MPGTIINNGRDDEMTGRPDKDVYAGITRKRRLFIASLFPVLLALVIWATMTGAAHLSADTVISAVLDRFVPNHFDVSKTNRIIVWELRLPPIAMAILIGIALAAAGCVLQSILDNPLASPFTLGISSGAGFGAALAIAFHATALFAGLVPYDYLVAAYAFLGALFTCFLIYVIGRVKGASTGTLVLAGIAVSYFFSSSLALIQYVVNEDVLRSIVFWMFGSFMTTTWEQVTIIFFAVAAILPIIYLSSWKLTALRTGEASAEALGVDMKRLRLFMLFCASLLAAVAVCFTGVIGFVGLVAPHVARIIVGDDHRFLLPAACLVGPILLVGAHIVSLTVIAPFILPVGVVTSFIGVPFFLILVLSKRGAVW